ncbi:hypothetical protein [Virgibacillus doumboii]|uniref:hypothetical protein n=1 Tax=Virgibacillus doumboii TaxID=2697503 RepID=UPI0013DF7C4D|nr:hypothetical protein [Virgibacillus doumboii]
MIRTGLILIPLSTVFYVLAVTVSFFASNYLYNITLIISAIVLGSLGTSLVFFGVLKDRVKSKKEEDQDDISKY